MKIQNIMNMENKIDIAELLKDCKEGTKLYSPVLGNCQLKSIERLIEVYDINRSCTSYFKLDGSYILGDECILFPSSDYRSWEGVRVENGELIIPEVKTCGKYYYYGDLPKWSKDKDIIKAEFERCGARNADKFIDYYTGTLYYIDNLGYIIPVLESKEHVEKELIAQGYKKLDLSYKPKDKELVWCWDNNFKFGRDLAFYDAKNNRVFNWETGERKSFSYQNYELYEGEYPEWAKDALKHLED